MRQTGRTTTLEERVLIVDMSRRGAVREIAAELARPLSTVRKWRQRYLREGRAGLSSQMGRLVAGALSTFLAELRAICSNCGTNILVGDHAPCGQKSPRTPASPHSVYPVGRALQLT